MNKLPIVSARNVSKTYNGRTVIDSVSLDVYPGQVTAFVGESGSGKTTLLNTLSTVARADDSPDSSIHVGGIESTPSSRFTDRFIAGVGKFMGLSNKFPLATDLVSSPGSRTDILDLNDRGKERYRALTGQIFQRSSLPGGLKSEENIETPYNLSEVRIDPHWQDYLIDILGVGSLMGRHSLKLSGGEAQRIGIVRALAHNPDITFADEPTSALDDSNKAVVHDLFREMAKEGKTVVLVSHEKGVENYADRTLRVAGGTVEVLKEGKQAQLDDCDNEVLSASR